MKNKLKLFITCIFSVFAVSVAGISTFAWFQQTQAEAQTVQSGTVTSGSSDLTINGVTGYKYAYDDTGDGIDYSSGHVSAYAASGNANPNIAQDETSDSLDAPTQGVGFYILGDDTWSAEYGNNKKAWSYFSSVRMEDKYGNNWAALINYDFSVNEEIKIVWYHYEVDNQGKNNATETEIIALGGSSSSYVSVTDYKIKFSTAGNYTIWVAGKTDATPNKTLYFVRNGNRVASRSIQNQNRKSIQRTASGNKNFYFYNKKNWGWSNWKIYTDKMDDWAHSVSLVDSGLVYESKKVYFAEIPSNSTLAILRGTENGDKQTFDYKSIGSDTTDSIYYVDDWVEGDNKGTLKKQGTFKSSVTAPKIRINNNGNWIDYSMTLSSSYPEDTHTQYEYQFSANTDSQFVLHRSTESGTDQWYHYSDKESGIDTTLFVSSGSDDNFKITRACSVKIFIKFKTDGTVKIWAENPVYYTLHVLGKRFNVASQSLGSAQELASYDIQKTNTNLINPTSSSDVTTVWFTDLNKYKAPASFKWYTDSELINEYDGTSYSSDSSNRLDLYCGNYEEKTIEITYKQSKIKGTTLSLNGTYGSATTPVALNIDKISSLNDTNIMKFGITGTFDVDNYVTAPTESHYSQYYNGWSSSGAGNTSSAYSSGTTLSGSTLTLTYYLIETKYSIIINYSYFDVDGTTTFSNNSLPATKSGTNYGFYSWTSGSQGVPLGTIDDVGLTVNVASNDDGIYNGEISTFYVFRHTYTAASNKLYSNPECTTPFTGHITANNTNLYVKMVARPMTTLYFAKPTDGGDVKDRWYTIKAHCYYKSGSSEIDPKTDTSYGYGKDIVLDYMKPSGYYCAKIPDDCYFILKGYNAAGNTDGITLQWTAEMGLSKTDEYGDARTTENVIQLWANGRWDWHATVTNKFYLVGENLTDQSSGSTSWDLDSGLVMQDGGSGTLYPDARCYITKVVLTSNVKFKIFNDLNGTWYGANNLSDDSLVYAGDDNGGDHNIVLNSGIAGKFNIYIDNNQANPKIHIEDAETGGYMYFTGPTGLEQSDTFQMGYGGKELGYSGDKNVLIYDQDIQVEKGDEFAIRNRFKGTYQWFDYTNVDDGSKTYNVEQGSTATLGEAVYSGGVQQANSTKSVTTIKFKKPGSYRIFVYQESDDSYHISIIDSPSDGYGYYIVPTSSSTETTELAGFTNGIKMRAIGSGTNKNIAMYTGLRVTSSDINAGKKYCFKSQDREFVTDNGARKRATVNKTYTYFYDNISQSATGLDQTSSTSNRTFNLPESTAFITFKNPGYYDIYLYNSDGHTYVSFAESKVGKEGNNFFTLNSIPKDRQDKQGIKAAQTTLVIRVDFTVTAKTSTTVNADLEFFDSTGLGNYLKYYAVFDIENFGGLDPYKYMRAHYYDESGFTNKTASGSLASTTINANDGNTHSCYIMIDYSENKIADLLTGSYLNNFMFVMRSTQG